MLRLGSNNLEPYYYCCNQIYRTDTDTKAKKKIRIDSSRTQYTGRQYMNYEGIKMCTSVRNRHTKMKLTHLVKTFDTSSLLNFDRRGRRKKRRRVH